MKGKPLVSVVVPAYNRAVSITGCLRSVQVQTYRDWEVIVVDDGSSDETPRMVAQLMRNDDRIRLIRQTLNRGAQAARNIGIRAASGKWITFLDSDDQFLPYSLEARLELARREKVFVVHSECQAVEIGGSMRRYGVPPILGQVYRRLLRGTGPVFPALFVAKHALERIAYLDESIVAFQEWDTAIRLAKYYTFGFEERPTFVYNDGNSPHRISSDLLRGAKGYEQVFHKHYMEILWHAGPGTLARHYRTVARLYEAAGNVRATRRCRLMALVWSVV